MEVLFEYRGSKREVSVGNPECLTGVISDELRRIGKSRALVLTSHDTLPQPVGRGRAPPEIYLLQKWSGLWNCFVDVRHFNEVSNGDRLAVIARPKPPSKLFFWCCCRSDSSHTSRNMVGGSGKNHIPKSHEIQTVDYHFRVLIEEGVTDDDWASDHNNALQQNQNSSGLLSVGERYVRGPSGRASWKLISHQGHEEERVEPGDSAGERRESTGDLESAECVREEGMADASVVCDATVGGREDGGEAEGVARVSVERSEESVGRDDSGPGLSGGGQEEPSEDGPAASQSPVSNVPAEEHVSGSHLVEEDNEPIAGGIEGSVGHDPGKGLMEEQM